MNMHHTTTKYNCGIDLHASCMYVCVMNREGEILLNKNIRQNNFAYFLKLILPWKSNLTIACESTFNWYILADFCEDEGINFVLGHAQNMKLIHGAKAKNDKIDSQKITHLLRSNMLPEAYAYPRECRSLRDLMRRRIYFVRERASLMAYLTLFERRELLKVTSRSVKKAPGALEAICSSIPVDHYSHLTLEACTNLIQSYNEVIGNIENEALKGIKKMKSQNFNLLKTAPGIGDILGMTILLETGEFSRFKTVKNFISYSRLIRCKAESAGKSYGTIGAKKGNPNLKWAFSEMVIHSRKYPAVRKIYEKLLQKHTKGKAMAIVRHKLGRAIYFMMIKQEPFNWNLFFGKK